MIFSDKYIDYSSKTKKELYESLVLFSILSNKTIVHLGKFLLQVALKLHIPISGIIKKTVFKHFCGGENIIESQKTIIQLGKHNIKTILDYSIEGKNDPNILEKTYKEVLKNIDEADNNNLMPFCVFKITGIASFNLLKKINKNESLSQQENTEMELLKSRLKNICEKAQNCKTPILVDAEESWIQDAIDKLVEELMYLYNKKDVIIYNTIQLYRSDKLNYIKKLHLLSKRKKFKLGLKLVRGAYMEKERARSKRKQYTCIIHKIKKDCDKDYNEASEYCIQHINDMALCFGTHNEISTDFIMKLMRKANILNNDKRIYFSQLLGMSDNISFYLAHYNYNVAKYVPYGPVKEVIPYLIRRAEENSAISNQTKQEIQRLKKALEQY